MEDNVSSDEDELFEDNGQEGPGESIGGDDDESEEEEQHFDISLAASHSYMGGGLVALGGRAVLEAGWRGRVPVLAHHGAVFPGEIVPMLLTSANDVAIITHAIENNKLFGLLCPDESGAVSGYGVLCEVFERGAAADEASLSFKARATHRFRCQQTPAGSVPSYASSGLRLAEVRVLPERRPSDPLRGARLASLDARRHPRSPHARRVRALDAALTPWPLFVYDMFDFRRMRRLIREHFKSMALERVPEEAVSLSFWTASNLALSARDRLALFVVDDALLRLHMETRLIARKSVLCCSACAREIARREHIFAMSSEGVHSNYTNLGGFMHDIVTVSAAANTAAGGAPSVQFSWFPGYSWTVALCAACRAHVGWRFDALRRNLRPQHFYGLCRNYVQPRAEPERGGTPADERRAARHPLLAHEPRDA